MSDPISPAVEHLMEQGLPGPEASTAGSLPPGEGKNLVPHFTTFASILNSVTRTYRWTYDEARKHSDANALALRRDATIMDALRERQMPTAQLAWHLEPANPADSREMEAVKTLTECIQSIPRFQAYKMSLLEALFYGRYGVAETFRWDFSRGTKRLAVVDHRPVNGDKLIFKWSGQAGILVHQQYEGTWAITDRGRAHFFTPEEREQLVIHKHEAEDADFWEPELAGGAHGVGIRGRVYWLWWLRMQIWSWLMDYLERVGAGGFTIYFYEAGNDNSLNEVTNAAQTQLTNNVILFPRYKDGGTGGPGIQRIEPSNAGANLLMNLVMDYFDAVIRRYILGEQILANREGLMVGKGGEELDANTFARRVKYDAVNLQETLTQDLVKVLAKYNTPGVTPPRFMFDMDKPNAEEVLNAASAFWNMGGTLDEDELRGILGLAAPEPGHNVLSKLPPVSPAGIGAMPTGVPQVGAPGPEGAGEREIPGSQGQAGGEPDVPMLFARRDHRIHYAAENLQVAPWLHGIARAYLQRSGRSGDPREDISLVPYRPLHPEGSRAVAHLYHTLPHSPTDPAVRSAYEAFKRETGHQWEHLIRSGMRMEPWRKEGQPYANSAEMRNDVLRHRHLWFFTGGEFPQDHLLSSPSGFEAGGVPLTHNDIFRAVHDVFGHALYGNQFGPRGEEHAYRVHSRFYSPAARPAMAMETRGQNSWVNFGPFSHLPVQTRPYAEQKNNVLPPHMLGDVVQTETPPAPDPQTHRLRMDRSSAEGSTPLFGDVVGGEDSAPPRTTSPVPRTRKVEKPVTSLFSGSAWYAPAGGVKLHGQFYQGGELLPDAAIRSLPTKHQTALAKVRIIDPLRAAQISVDAPILSAEARGGKGIPRFGVDDRTAGKFTVADFEPHVRDYELRLLHNATIKDVVSLANRLAPNEEIEAAAQGGRIKRNWYRNFAKVLGRGFAEDAPRLAAVIAATSPRNGPRTNLAHAFRSWAAWSDAGRPTDPDEINRVLQEAWVKGKMPGMARGLIRNLTRSFSADDPGSPVMGGDPDRGAGVLSGYKVDSFRPNLLGFLDPVAHDVWDARLLGVPHADFARNQKGLLNYLAANAKYRMVAEGMNRKLQPGERPWEPADVQSATWSFFRTLAWMQGASRGSMRERWGGEPLTPITALAAALHRDVKDTVDYVSLLEKDDEIPELARAIGFDFRPLRRPRGSGAVEGETGAAVAPLRDRSRQGSFERVARRTGPYIGGFLGGRVQHARPGSPVRYTSAPAVVPSPAGGQSFPGTPGSPSPASPSSDFAFFSPNTEEGLTFEQAFARSRSSNQVAFRKLSSHILDTVGLHEHQAFDAIGDWSDGAENSVVQKIDGDPDPSQVEYAAAWYGLLGHQKVVLTFRADPQGPDAVYQIPVAETDTEKLRSQLSQAGIPFRTIVPSPRGHLVIVVDQGRQLRPAVEAFAEANHATVREAAGTATELGGGSTRSAARRRFRNIIRAYESGGKVRTRYRPPVHADPARYARPTRPHGFPPVKAPAGGAVVRGVYYPGGSMVPKEARSVAIPNPNSAPRGVQYASVSNPAELDKFAPRVQVDANEPGLYGTSFEIGGKPFSTEFLESNSPDEWHFSFQRDATEAGSETQQATNDRSISPFEVFGHVGYSLKRFIEEKQPKQLYFISDQKAHGRTPLYDRLAKIIAKHTGYQLTTGRAGDVWSKEYRLTHPAHQPPPSASEAENMKYAAFFGGLRPQGPGKPVLPVKKKPAGRYLVPSKPKEPQPRPPADRGTYDPNPTPYEAKYGSAERLPPRTTSINHRKRS